ncbi:MAG: elongation factor G [Cyanobacteria bacterium P01_A01_bin.45]
MIPRTRIRNIGISAHIDSGKTTLSERILFYTGRIHAMEEVHAGGATLDWTPLEIEHGITISSAATSCVWQDTHINLIDTPGHVDFTIEVERALRVLDGAVMVLCAVAGVQSQSVTVDRQMKRYDVPRIAFINKMDRLGANPFQVLQGMVNRLGLNPVLLQYPIGSGGDFQGVIDLITMEAHYYQGDMGTDVVKKAIPDILLEEAQQGREKMLDTLSLYSEEMTQLLIDEQNISEKLVWKTIRQGTLNLEITPVLLGSAFKNKGVQDLLDAVTLYLPSPLDREAVETQEGTIIYPQVEGNLVALAFKLTMESFGQLTYIRIYSGKLKPGDKLYNSRTGEKVQIGRILKMHANKREEIAVAIAGDIVALNGVECASGDTLCSEKPFVSLESMFIPEPVVTLAISPKKQQDAERLSRALNRFGKEDPTFKVTTDPQSGETLISGMGELHLDIYLERIKREYQTQVYIGEPAVAYKEAIANLAEFDFKFKKQTGGPGQYGHVTGYIEPSDQPFIFDNHVVGGAIPKEYIPSCEKGFQEAMNSGFLEGYPVTGVRVVLTGGSFHPTDSSEFSFKIAAYKAFKEAYEKAKPYLLEPIMLVEVETPLDMVGKVQGNLSARGGLILGSQVSANTSVISAEVPLAKMFKYAGNLRTISSGMANFSMQFACYRRKLT